jgi:hypothetical protein
MNAMEANTGGQVGSGTAAEVMLSILKGMAVNYKLNPSKHKPIGF